VKELTFFRCNMLVDHWKANLKRNTVSCYRWTLRRLLAWLVDQGAPKDCVTQLKRVPGFEARQRTLHEQEIQSLIENAEPWMRCFLLICLTTSLRSGEARRVSPWHFDGKSDPPMIRHLRVKNNHEHSVPVTPELRALFDSAVAAKDSKRPFIDILKGQPEDQPMSFKTLLYHFHALKKKAGIAPEVRMHDLRRTALCRAYELSGKNIVMVQKLAGHASIATTAQYLQHIDQASLAPLAEKLVPFRNVTPVKKKSEKAG